MENKIGPIVIAVCVIAAIAIGFSKLPVEELFTLEGPVPMILFFFVIIVEVIIAPIPGGIISFLGAAQFGFWKAWPLMYVSNIVGGTLVFWLGRKLGQEFVEEQISPEDRKKYNALLEKHSRFLWFFYSVPIIPIDTVSILLSLTRLKFRTYFLILVTALPFYTGITALLGSRFGEYIPYLNTISAVVFGGIVLLILWTAYNWYKKRRKLNG